ncbi:hypothetical protein FKR81_16845 [Lentzea tibetensis]|uniref:Uncharacterized protein n=1 Tax=Lentzea tibetensis TaxID=2591470 RepID=A0A563EUC0_9PSEU|nr:hypothetical protein [Lentzea tibetensis]TWP51276.1 hypothetical protein FKR81_16845 [Lentzea tibetensis]
MRPEAELVALLIDDTAGPADRVAAMRELAGLGNSAGYCGVVAAAEFGTRLPSHRDDTFPSLAAAVATSRPFALRNGTEARRLDAVRAMVRRADELYFGPGLVEAMDEHTLPHVADDLAETIARGVETVDATGLGEQLADLFAVLGRVDPRSALLLEKYFKD